MPKRNIESCPDHGICFALRRWPVTWTSGPCCTSMANFWKPNQAIWQRCGSSPMILLLRTTCRSFETCFRSEGCARKAIPTGGSAHLVGEDMNWFGKNAPGGGWYLLCCLSTPQWKNMHQKQFSWCSATAWLEYLSVRQGSRHQRSKAFFVSFATDKDHDAIISHELAVALRQVCNH